MLKRHTCVSCGAAFDGGPTARFCPVCRVKRQRRHTREYEQRKKRGLARELGSIDTCERCGNTYTVAGPNQRFCPECGARHTKERVKKYSRQYYLQNDGKGRRRLPRWTKERVLQRIQERREAGLPLNSGVILADDPALDCAARRLFGSWGKAVEAAGLDYEAIKSPKEKTRWSKELVLQRIKERRSAGLALNYADVVADNEPLTSASRHLFGSWGKAITAAGLDYEAIKAEARNKPSSPPGTWDAEVVIEQIRERAERGESLNAHAAQTDDSRLYSAAIRHLGSWGKAVEAAGLDYLEHRRTAHRGGATAGKSPNLGGKFVL